MKTLNLALQGGGSHGAFTWGVLDALLADGRIAVEGLSGTSAGALNAVALASGHAAATASRQDTAAAARASLTQLWEEIGSWGALGSWQAQVSRLLWGGWAAEMAHSPAWNHAWRDWFSPYQANPLDINPLRDLLARRIDFEAIARPTGPKVFVSATHVSTGKAVIFTGRALTAEAVLASACLPTVFRAVEIDGQPYWDGGYAVNPALTPLIDACNSSDIMVVQINPLRREGAPHKTPQILDRINELTFNASLLTQMRSIDFVNRLLAEGALAPGRCKPVRLHRIDGGAAMQAYSAASKSRPDPVLIRELFLIGQDAAQQWLAKHFDAIGVRSTVDVRRDYLDDTSLALPRSSNDTPVDERRWAGFRPWLARWFRRSRRD